MSPTEIILSILLLSASAAIVITLIENKHLASSRDEAKSRLKDLNRQYDELDKLYDLSEQQNIKLKVDLEKANKYGPYNREIIINTATKQMIPLTAKMVVPCELQNEEDLIKKELSKELYNIAENFISYEESYDSVTHSKILRATLLVANK